MTEEQSAQKKTKTPTVEEHRTRLGVDPAIFAGVREAEGWKAGRRVSASAFKDALKRFEKGSVKGTPKEGKNGRGRN